MLFVGIGCDFIFFFFFSSRRRHTRWTGDWSSDVCSSDLMRALLADDVTFAGPLGRANGADEYVEAFQRLFAITTDVVVELMVARENDVLSWFELHTSVAPPIPVANLARVDA